MFTLLYSQFQSYQVPHPHSRKIKSERDLCSHALTYSFNASNVNVEPINGIMNELCHIKADKTQRLL